MKRDEIWNCDRHSVEPVTLSKYEQMWKLMVKCLSKQQGRGIKISEFNSIRVAKSIIFLNILRVIAPRVTSSLAIVFFTLSLRLHPLVYILWHIGRRDCLPSHSCCPRARVFGKTLVHKFHISYSHARW